MVFSVDEKTLEGLLRRDPHEAALTRVALTRERCEAENRRGRRGPLTVA